MTPRDWLLAFIAADPARPVDPLRLQKGLFLLAMRGAIPEEERYMYEPYAYGPMSRMLYADLRALVAHGLVDEVPVRAARWRAVRATPAGVGRARERMKNHVRAVAAVTEVRRELGALGFADLLERVYDAHPEYAVNSVFRRRS